MSLIWDNGDVREATTVEIEELQAGAVEADRQYWLTVDYDEAVNAEIRKRYTESQEHSMHRQREEKPDEYSRYFEYCEQCKVFVKQKMAEHGREV